MRDNAREDVPMLFPFTDRNLRHERDVLSQGESISPEKQYALALRTYLRPGTIALLVAAAPLSRIWCTVAVLLSPASTIPMDPSPCLNTIFLLFCDSGHGAAMSLDESERMCSARHTLRSMDGKRVHSTALLCHAQDLDALALRHSTRSILSSLSRTARVKIRRTQPGGPAFSSSVERLSTPVESTVGFNLVVPGNAHGRDRILTRSSTGHDEPILVP